MGVPKFFRYISERYPCLSEVVKEYQVPDFDNMYLDMNGIIHTCSHPDDSNPHFRITEEKIFQDIFHYISMLFKLIKPKKLFFMAIDGVAPRAKMNQQRGRRFRSAREAEMLEKKAKENGEELPTEKRFDSNCITPGTVFMARLHEQLRYYIRHKLTTDPTWSKCKFILSGHETPGEGEHKIMDYIRYARSQPDYDPNTKHCLYGLDADLIMLGLCTHEPHFSLLREEVKFGGKNSQNRQTTPEETTFFLLHLSLMRNYLEEEFITLKSNLTFGYDLDKVIDDWVLMGFLVGNDFIPNLPHMHINSDALPVLYRTYMKVLPTLDGYINEAGVLNLTRFETFMQELANVDRENFHDIQGDLKYFEGKTGRKPNMAERKSYKYVPDNSETFDIDTNDIKNQKHSDFGFDNDLQNLVDKTKDLFRNAEESDDDYIDISDDDEGDLLEAEFKLHKKDYYINKLDYSKVTEEVLRNQAECYVRAIQWNLHYYYHGCISWSWYYPHHYAPYISDVTNFKDMNITFDYGRPFNPFEQLLAVLPSGSMELLPTPYHSLMISEKSPIYHYYPIEFETDLNGKKNDWEAVVLIPFIDEKNLIAAMEPFYDQLTDAEKKRNTPGPMLVYTYSAIGLGEYSAPEYFSNIKDCHAEELKIWREDLDIPREMLKKGPLPNALMDVFFPGFPTLKHLKYESTLIAKGVKVFDHPSRNDNMILKIIHDTASEPLLVQVAGNLLGKVIWVGWPHLTQAKVLSVSNKDMYIHYNGKINDTGDEETDQKFNDETEVTREKNIGGMLKQWNMQRDSAVSHNMTRMGIDIGNVNILVHAVNLVGYRYCPGSSGVLTLGREWCKTACSYALQAVIPKLEVIAPELNQIRYKSVSDAFQTYDKVFILAKQYYGCMGMVLDSSHAARTTRIKISFVEDNEPSFGSSNGSGFTQTKYIPGHHISARCGISVHLLSRITGMMFVYLGHRETGQPESQKYNIGLNLKFNKRNEEVAGYTRRCPESHNWLYSTKCTELLEEYVCKFPNIFSRLTSILNSENFYESDFFPDEMGKGKIQEVVEWLSKQPHNKAPHQSCGTVALDPNEIASLARNIDAQIAQKPPQGPSCSLQMKINILFKPELHTGSIVPPDPKADYKLYDRVVCIDLSSMVPLGYRGTIVGIEPEKATLNSVKLSDKMNTEVTYLILFDQSFPGGLTVEGLDIQRLYRLRCHSLLNISFGRETRNQEISNDSRNGFNRRDQATRFHNSPTILRPNGGHQSAFASYSPTKDKQAPTSAPSNDSHFFSQPPPPLMSFQNPPFYYSVPPPSVPTYPPANQRPGQQPFQPQNSYERPTIQPPTNESDMLKAMLNIPSPGKKNTPIHPFSSTKSKQDSQIVDKVASFIQDHANFNSSQSFHNSPDKNQPYNNFGVSKAPDTNWRQKREEPSPKTVTANNWRSEEHPLPAVGQPYPKIKDGLISRDWSNILRLQENGSVVEKENSHKSADDELAAAGRKFQKAIAQISTKLPAAPSIPVQAKPQTTAATSFVPLQAVTRQRKSQGNLFQPKNSLTSVHPDPLVKSETSTIPATAPKISPSEGTIKSVKKKKSRIAANFPVQL